MKEYQLGAVESRFADLIWAGAPIATGELVRQAEQALGWKRTTTYTVLKRLCERGLFQTQDSVVTALISREEFYAMKSCRFVEESFVGSLPAFLAAFTARKKLSSQEIEQIRRMIDTCGEEEDT